MNDLQFLQAPPEPINAHVEKARGTFVGGQPVAWDDTVSRVPVDFSQAGESSDRVMNPVGGGDQTGVHGPAWATDDDDDDDAPVNDIYKNIRTDMAGGYDDNGADLCKIGLHALQAHMHMIAGDHDEAYKSSNRCLNAYNRFHQNLKKALG